MPFQSIEIIYFFSTVIKCIGVCFPIHLTPKSSITRVKLMGRVYVSIVKEFDALEFNRTYVGDLIDVDAL